MDRVDIVTKNDIFETHTFKIPDENLELFKEKFAKLSKRAVKLNSEPISYEIVRTYTEKLENPASHGYEKDAEIFNTYHDVVVSGPAPKLEGWLFVGILDHNQTNEGMVNILNSVPGESIPKKYHQAKPDCDHCGKRLYRKDTFIVRNNQDYKQVGRACLKDFLGHKSPEHIASYAQFLSTLESELNAYTGDRGNHVDPVYDIEKVFAYSAAAIREKGFVSSSAIEKGLTGPTTKSVVYANLNPWFRTAAERREFEIVYKVTITEEDVVTAKEAIEWIKNHKDENNDFIFNLKQIIKLPFVKGKQFGYIAAGTFSWVKERDKIVFEKKQKEEANDTPLGNPGDKITFTATVVKVRQFQGRSYNYYDSGVRAIYTMKTTDGRIVVWFTDPNKMNEGDTITIKASIEKAERDDYSPFKGVTKTIIKRGRIQK